MKKAINEFAVVLEDPKRVYSSGDHVYGTVILSVNHDVEIHKLSLNCHGEAYVSWPENAGTYTRYYYYREEYFNNKTCIYEQEKWDQDNKTENTSKTSSPKTYSFSFRFTIPGKVLPPSFESVHGYIRYLMRAEIQNRKGKTKFKSESAKFIIGDYQEHDEQELDKLGRDQQEGSNRQEISTLVGRSCHSACTVTLSAHTDKLLYQGGQSIHITVHIDKQRSLENGTIEVALVRLTKYSNLKGNITYSKNMIVTDEKLLDQEISPNDVNITLSVPQPIYPTMEVGCQCINVNYYIQVRLSSKFRKVPMVMIPVIIVSSSASSSSSSSSSPTTSSSFQSSILQNGQAETTTRNNSPAVSCTDLSAGPISLVNSGFIDDEPKEVTKI